MHTCSAIDLACLIMWVAIIITSVGLYLYMHIVLYMYLYILSNIHCISTNRVNLKLKWCPLQNSLVITLTG